MKKCNMKGPWRKTFVLFFWEQCVHCKCRMKFESVMSRKDYWCVTTREYSCMECYDEQKDS